MEIPGLGPLTPDEYQYASEPVPVQVFGGRLCRFVVDGDEYPEDPAPADYHRAIESFRALDESALDAATEAVFAYYRDVAASFDEQGWEYTRVAGPGEVWQHVTFGRDVEVARDADGDGRIHISVECECSWEVEHGLQLVFRDGRAVTRVGPYDGHLTNESAAPGADVAGLLYVSTRTPGR